MNKTVILLSGGLDSTTLLYDAAQNTDVVRAVGFDYGQRHATELQHAAYIADGLGVRFARVDLRGLALLLEGSALTDPRVEVPDGHYAEDTMKATIVPNRNAIMLNIAVGIAVGAGAHEVRAAMHAGDHPVYPDCRPEFVDKLNELIPIATETEVQVRAPFITKTKGDIVKRGMALGVPFGETWSCYKGGAIHCGRCGTCIERHEAFVEAGMLDPTVYEDQSLYQALEAEGRVQ